MERSKFLFKTVVASLSFLLVSPRAAQAKDDEGFTMSSGPLLGGANGTEGA